jgi:hypothetical protein
MAEIVEILVRLIINCIGLHVTACSGQTSWLLTRMSRGQFPALPDFLSSSESGMGSTQPHEHK